MKGDMYSGARKLGHMSVPSVQGVKGIVQGRNSEISEEMGNIARRPRKVEIPT